MEFILLRSVKWAVNWGVGSLTHPRGATSGTGEGVAASVGVGADVVDTSVGVGVGVGVREDVDVEVGVGMRVGVGVGVERDPGAPHADPTNAYSTKTKSQTQDLRITSILVEWPYRSSLLMGSRR